MIAILGGGITGLSAAYQLKKAKQPFVLLEAEDRLGGKIQSFQEKGYTCELGPNTVLINNAETKALLKELDLEDQLLFPDEVAIKNRFVLKNGAIEAIPNSFSSALKSKLFGINTLGKVLSEPLRKKNTSNQEESLASFAKRRFGKQIYDDFITPFVTGIYAGDPEKMSIDYVLSILKQAEQEHGSVLRGMMKIMKEKKKNAQAANLPKQKIFSFKGGLQSLIDALAIYIQEETRLESKVLHIEKQGQKYTIQYSKGSATHQVEACGIISCLPSYALSAIYAESQFSFSAQLKKIRNIPAVVLHFGFKKENIGFSKKGFGILSRAKEKVPFLGILFNSHFFPHTSSKENSLITVICGGYRYPEIGIKGDNEIIEEVLESIMPLLQIKQQPNFSHVHRWQNGIPQYELGYASIETSIKEFESKNSNFYVGGNFYNGISVSDCIKNGTNLALKFI